MREDGGARRRHHRQHLRRHSRGSAAGAAGHPQDAPRAAAREDHRHRLRRADRARDLRRHGRGRLTLSAMPRRSAPRHSCASRRHDSPASGSNDIMSVRETAPHLIAGFGEPRPRLRRGAERLRPSLHLLHHPLWPRPFALGADGRRGSRRSARLSRTAIARSC